jgi:hypothetical protein
MPNVKNVVQDLNVNKTTSYLRWKKLALHYLWRYDYYQERYMWKINISKKLITPAKRRPYEVPKM